MSDFFIIRCDGGSRGNPGNAGFGAAIFDSAENVIGKYTGFIGKQTNNVAEYHGVIAGLHAALKHDLMRIHVELDSNLIVNQLTGKWKVKNEGIKPLAIYADKLVKKFEHISFTWIPREKNKIADYLANLAMDNPGIYAVDETDYQAYHCVEEKPELHVSSSVVETEEKHPHVPSAAKLRLSRSASATSSLSDQTKSPKGATQYKEEKSRLQYPTVSPISVLRTPGWGTLSSGWTRVILVQHGQTSLSIDRRFTGSSNPHLTELGKEQIQRVGRYIAQHAEPELIVSSPLSRCLESADILANYFPESSREIDQRLRETDFGEWEGLLPAEAQLKNTHHYARWMNDTHIAPPCGESLDTTYERANDFIYDIVPRFIGSTIVACTHVGPIKAMIGACLGCGSRIAFQIFIDTASVTVLDVSPQKKGYIRTLNETGYFSL